jgi:pimeloyl-ACP methyl ester carboxylesterase
MAIIERTIATSAATIRLTESDGRGMPLLMLHGSGSARGIFDRQMQSTLAERFRLIAPDLPGHGESSDALDNGDSYTLPGLAKTIGEVIDKLEVKRVVVLGWSLGGHIALELMSYHAAVAGVMIMGAPPIGRGPIALLRAFRTNLDTGLASKEKFSDADTQRFARLCFDGHADDVALANIRRADGRLRKIMFGSMMSGRCADEKRLVETSSKPVAVINGSDDPFVRARYISALNYRNLWGGLCHVIPDAGHDAFRSHYDWFNPMLMRFASEIEMGAAAPTLEPIRRAS